MPIFFDRAKINNHGLEGFCPHRICKAQENHLPVSRHWHALLVLGLAWCAPSAVSTENFFFGGLAEDQ